MNHNDPCPFCNRPMKRDIQARREEPYCPKCLSDRIVAAGGRRLINPRVEIDERGYAVIVEAKG
jgi:Zn finger protein HypA/HybF involved in hydrogenase expression